MKLNNEDLMKKEFVRIHNTLTDYIEQVEDQLYTLKTSYLRLEILKYSPKLYNEFKEKDYLEDYDCMVNHLELTDYEPIMKQLSRSLDLPGITEFISYWMDAPLSSFHKKNRKSSNIMARFPH